MEIAKKIVEACAAARQQAKLKLRWPVKQVLILPKEEKNIQAVKHLKKVLLKMCNTKDIGLVKEKPKGEFSEVSFDLGKILVDKKLDEKLLEEALIRELIREIQTMRKKHGFHVSERILLNLSSDEKTNKALEKYVQSLKKEVGAKEIIVGKLEGEHKGSLKFEKLKVEIAFDKIS